jgi:hypothetical protein
LNLTATNLDGGTSPVPHGATAVVINLTGVTPTASTYLQAWATGQTPPPTVVLNINAGQILPNLAVVSLGVADQITLRNAVGALQVVADVVGYYIPSGGAQYHPLQPMRLLDTRNSIGGFARPIGPSGTLTIPIAGRGGVSPTATAVVLNVTATDTTNPSYLSLYPSDVARPLVSDLNFVAGDTVPNLVTVKLSGTGEIDLFNALGTADVVVDVEGWYG